MLHRRLRYIGFVFLAIAFIAMTRSAQAADTANSPEMLKFYIGELKKYPEDRDLRESVIKMAQSLKPRPRVPEEAERALARGNVYLKRAVDVAGYKEAITEFQTAIMLAPWLSDGYLGLSEAQEKAGLYTDAIQNLKFHMMADPQAKGSREIKKKIYELEVYAEEAKKAQKQAKAQPAPSPATPASPAPTPAPPVAQVAVKATVPAPKGKQQGFAGSWFFKDTGPRGGDISVHAFTLSYAAKDELTVVPPKRSAESIGTVSSLEVSGNKIKIAMIWELTNAPGYWKTEEYNLVLSDDEKTLSGTYHQKDSRLREFSEDRVYVRQ